MQCPVCGRQVDDDAAFCSGCGARLAGDETSAASATMRDMAADYDRRLREHPEDDDARYQLALVLMYDRQWGRASEHLLEVVRRAPDFADAHANLAVCLTRLGRPDRALEAVDAALALAPDSDRYRALRERISARAAADQ